MLGLALFGLATLAAARTEQTGSLASGYGFSYLVALGLVLLAMVLVATQLNHQACQAELARQRQQAVQTRADTLMPQELKKQ
jgi:ABC-type phosphate transport system permease subunit